MENATHEHTENRQRRPSERGHFRDREPRVDEKVTQVIETTIQKLQNSLAPLEIHDLNGFERKQLHRYFENNQEYDVKTYRNGEIFVMKVYPVGGLKRLAEQRAQEVLMKGETADLPPMGSYERFVVHNYLKDRGGIRTESSGEGEERHIIIFPVFGRSLKKAKRRLT